MSKQRVHELAKKLGVETKEILNAIAELGITGKTHSSAIEPEVVEKIEKFLKKKAAPPKLHKVAVKTEKKKPTEEKEEKKPKKKIVKPMVEAKPVSVVKPV
ncbi:MAG: translation initiation factor IF-2 N-terminal domain-containing protein, partial [Nitrospirae bacterium]|nr:translation initiation factor IF-2 N-terminal domain-containing protein [Nitrospirota bacterium]